MTFGGLHVFTSHPEQSVARALRRVGLARQLETVTEGIPQITFYFGLLAFRPGAPMLAYADD